MEVNLNADSEDEPKTGEKEKGVLEEGDGFSVVSAVVDKGLGANACVKEADGFVFGLREKVSGV